MLWILQLRIHIAEKYGSGTVLKLYTLDFGSDPDPASFLIWIHMNVRFEHGYFLTDTLSFNSTLERGCSCHWKCFSCFFSSDINTCNYNASYDYFCCYKHMYLALTNTGFHLTILKFFFFLFLLYWGKGRFLFHFITLKSLKCLWIQWWGLLEKNPKNDYTRIIELNE